MDCHPTTPRIRSRPVFLGAVIRSFGGPEPEPIVGRTVAVPGGAGAGLLPVHSSTSCRQPGRSTPPDTGGGGPHGPSPRVTGSATTGGAAPVGTGGGMAVYLTVMDPGRDSPGSGGRRGGRHPDGRGGGTGRGRSPGPPRRFHPGPPRKTLAGNRAGPVPRDVCPGAAGGGTWFVDDTPVDFRHRWAESPWCTVRSSDEVAVPSRTSPGRGSEPSGGWPGTCRGRCWWLGGRSPSGGSVGRRHDTRSTARESAGSRPAPGRPGRGARLRARRRCVDNGGRCPGTRSGSPLSPGEPRRGGRPGAAVGSVPRGEAAGRPGRRGDGGSSTGPMRPFQHSPGGVFTPPARRSPVPVHSGSWGCRVAFRGVRAVSPWHSDSRLYRAARCSVPGTDRAAVADTSQSTDAAARLSPRPGESRTGTDRRGDGGGPAGHGPSPRPVRPATGRDGDDPWPVAADGAGPRRVTAPGRDRGPAGVGRVDRSSRRVFPRPDDPRSPGHCRSPPDRGVGAGRNRRGH
jgi:hypothetical protein